MLLTWDIISVLKPDLEGNSYVTREDLFGQLLFPGVLFVLVLIQVWGLFLRH